MRITEKFKSRHRRVVLSFLEYYFASSLKKKEKKTRWEGWKKLGRPIQVPLQQKKKKNGGGRKKNESTLKW